MSFPDNDYIFQLAASTGPGLGAEHVLFAARTSGLYRSLDGGQTWELAYASLHASQPLQTIAVCLAPDFRHEPSVFAGLNGAILCSYDGGATWQPGRLPAPPPVITSLVISPDYEEDGTIFAGTNEDGVLVSNDRGRNWASWNFGMLDLHSLCLAISPEFAADETLFAGVESGLLRSANGGRAWKEINLPFGFDAVLSLAFSPDYARDRTFLIGTENNGLLLTQDAGKTWRSLGKMELTEPINAISFYPGPGNQQGILLLHGGELLGSNDGGENWTPWPGIADRNCTALLVLGENRDGFLMGCEDGEILTIHPKLSDAV